MWPASLDAARQPFRSVTWAAAMSVIVERDLARTRRLGLARLQALTGRLIVARAAQAVPADREAAVHGPV